MKGEREKAEIILSEFSYTMKDALYKAVRFDKVCEDIRDHEDDMELEKPLTEGQVKYAAEQYVYGGSCDYYRSYWDNIETVVNMALEICMEAET